ncbi:MAG: ATP-binding protein [bacterium]
MPGTENLPPEVYRALFECHPAPMWVYDLDTLRFLAVNDAAILHYGYSSDEFLSMTIRDIRPPEDVPALLENVARVTEGIDLAGVWRHRKKDGSLIDVSIVSHTLLFGGRKAELVMATDVTGKLRLEASLRQAQKYEAIGLLAGGVAHNLNNLMTVVEGYSTMVLDRMAPSAPWRREVEAIHRAGKRAVGLTSKLLGYSRRQLVQPVDVDLSVFLPGLEEEIRRAAGPGIDVSFLASSTALVVRIDPDLLRNVILHIVDNARDAMPGGGSLIMRVMETDRSGEERSLVPPGRYALLSLTDTGVGMESNIQAHIFDPFFTTKGFGMGEGLSLPAAYGFVKQSKGFIFVDSTPGRGTTVSLYFPSIGPGREEPAAP